MATPKSKSISKARPTKDQYEKKIQALEQELEVLRKHYLEITKEIRAFSAASELVNYVLGAMAYDEVLQASLAKLNPIDAVSITVGISKALSRGAGKYFSRFYSMEDDTDDS